MLGVSDSSLTVIEQDVKLDPPSVDYALLAGTVLLQCCLVQAWEEGMLRKYHAMGRVLGMCFSKGGMGAEMHC